MTYSASALNRLTPQLEASRISTQSLLVLPFVGRSIDLVQVFLFEVKVYIIHQFTSPVLRTLPLIHLSGDRGLLPIHFSEVIEIYQLSTL